MRMPLIQCYLQISIVCLIFPSYLVISSWDQIPSLIYLVLLITSIDAGIGIQIWLKIISFSYKESQILVRNCRRIKMGKRGNENKWFKRFVKSCWPCKLMIGDGRFVDECTPLVVFDFCISSLASLLLV